jgi:hypothetical protein
VAVLTDGDLSLAKQDRIGETSPALRTIKGALEMKKLSAVFLSSLLVVALGMVSMNASATGYVASSYGKLVTGNGSCVKGSGRKLC